MIALAIRNRRRLLMQLDSPLKLWSSTSLKRSFSQAISPQSTPMSNKFPRVANSFSRSAPTSSERHAIATPPSEMPRSSHHHPTNRASPLRSLRHSHIDKHIPGPLHDLEYIHQHYRKSELPLKQTHLLTPQESLRNFFMHSFGTPPSYQATMGPFDSSVIWRQVFYLRIFCHD
jgi:hypothetical protein